MLVTFENQPLEEKVGSDSGKIEFIQAFPRVVSFQDKISTFHASGIFQLKGGPPVLVLPWFLKSKDGSVGIKDDYILLFDEIARIKTILDSKIDLDTSEGAIEALDLVAFSFLTGLRKTLTKLCTANYHEEVTDQINVIKGRWNLSRDLANGPRPLKFTCTFGSLEIDTPFFRFIKASVRQFEHLLRAKRNQALLKEIANFLIDVSTVPLTQSLAREARVWLRSHKFQNELASLLSFIEGLFFEQRIYSEKAGVCFQFEMDRFFEELVEKLWEATKTFEIRKQVRDDILGGAVWKWEISPEIPDKETRATQISIPDIIALKKDHYHVVECKYKPLRIPFINQEDSSQTLSHFGRSDRNQLLSFVASLRPSPEMAARHVTFSVFFPCVTAETFRMSRLCFQMAELNVTSIKKVLSQSREKNPGSKPLEIKFVGINIISALEQLVRRDNSMMSEIINLLVKADRKPEEVEPSAMEVS